MPEITRRSFMALLAAAGVAVRAPAEVLPAATPTTPMPKPEKAPSKAQFTWTPEGGKPIPLQVTSVSQSVHTESIMDDDYYGGALRVQPLRSGEIEVETLNFWDCGDMRQRGTLRFTVGRQVVSVKADVWSLDRESGPLGYRQRTVLGYHELTAEEA